MDNYSDYFTREELVRVLATVPYTPGRLGELGLFDTVPLTGTAFSVEVEAGNGGRILTATTRGAPRQHSGLEKRAVHTFGVTASYGDDVPIMADTVLGARGAGTSGAREVLMNRRTAAVTRLRRTVDLTLEKLRMQCLLSPATTEFGAAAAAAVIAVQTDATKLRQEIFNKITLPLEAALKDVTYTGLHVMCSDGYWADLIEAKSIRDTYLNYQAAAELRGAVANSFVFGGVTWERYRGTSDCKIPDNEARAFPTGVNDVFWQAFAPNDTVESVGSGALGQPYYMGSMELRDSQGTKGWTLSVATHPRMLCGRPAAVLPLTKS